MPAAGDNPWCSGPRNTSLHPRHGKAFYRAANRHPTPYGIAACELGNELWGHFQIGWQTPEGYAACYKMFYNAIRDRVPSLTMLFANGVDVDIFTGWNAALLREDGPDVSYLTTHFVVGMDEMVNKNADHDEVLAADFARAPIVTVETLAADSLTSMKEVYHPDLIHPVESYLKVSRTMLTYKFPPHSVTVLILATAR